MIVATGIDIIETARVRDLILRHGDRFLNRWFTAEEIRYCTAKSLPYLHFAARLAAKEAAVKVLGLDWSIPICLRDIEVRQSRSGVPSMILTSSARRAAESREISVIHLSLSHCREYAVASVIAESRASTEPGQEPEG